MEYKFVNPSDPYTFLAEDFETATHTVLTLGPQYGDEPRDGGENVPLFFLGDADYLTNWYQEHFGHTIEEGADAKRGAIADYNGPKNLDQKSGENKIDRRGKITVVNLRSLDISSCFCCPLEGVKAARNHAKKFEIPMVATLVSQGLALKLTTVEEK